MLNGQNGDMTPYSGRPQIEGEIGIGQVGIVEELMEAIVVGDASFHGFHIFVHALIYEWRLEDHVMASDEEAR